jgi:ATP/maltotriose-dependent transcriptional regulator MalT
MLDYASYAKHPLDIRIKEDLEFLRTQLGEAAFAEAWEAGTAMTREQLTAYALQPIASSASTPLAAGTQAVAQPAESQPLVEPLSERELEILRVVAAGRSNREIASELFLALGTVKWYLNAINTKLGVSSRTQAVARARELGLLP